MQAEPGRRHLRVREGGFGDYVGFNSAIGYRASACAGNTSYWVLITATTSAVVPAFGAGDTVLAVVVSAIGVWLFVYIITIAKVVPILMFIVIAMIAFKADVFTDNFWGGDDRSASSIWEQATGTILITVFASWESRVQAFTRGWHPSGKTWGGPPSLDSSVCSAFSRW
jgi:hypothetical protein